MSCGCSVSAKPLDAKPLDAKPLDAKPLDAESSTDYNKCSIECIEKKVAEVNTLMTDYDNNVDELSDAFYEMEIENKKYKARTHNMHEANEIRRQYEKLERKHDAICMPDYFYSTRVQLMLLLGKAEMVGVAGVATKWAELHPQLVCACRDADAVMLGIEHNISKLENFTAVLKRCM